MEAEVLEAGVLGSEVLESGVLEAGGLEARVVESGALDTERKYVLFVATGVGLGHLLGALLNSAYYAWRTGRALALDMREFHYVTGDKHAGFFEQFALEVPPGLEVITDLAVVDRLRQDAGLHFLRLDTERLNVDQPFPDRVLLIPCLVPGDPYPISAKRKDTPFHIHLRGKLLGAWHEVMRRPEWSGPVIGLHYRSTVGEVTERMTKAITPDYEERYRAVKDNYIATALAVAQQAGYANPAFLVTSDDMDFVTYVRDRLPNSFSLATRLPDQEWAAWVRAHGHDFGIMSEAVNDLWCLSACDQLVHFRSGFSHFAILNSPKLDQSTVHYVHVPALKEILDSLGPQEAVAWARGAVRKANIRRLQQRYLFDWLADALERVGQTEAAARERQRAQWHWEYHFSPVVDNPEKPHVIARLQRGDLTGVLGVAQRAVQAMPGNPYWFAGYGGSLSNILAQMGRWQEAIPPARRALEIAPEDPFLYEHLGFVLTGAGVPQEGEQAIRQAIAMDAEVGRFHTALGACLLRQKRGAEAVEAFRAAVRLEPDDPHLLRRLGGALVALGEYDAAEAAYRQALLLRSEAGPHIDLYECFIRQRRFRDALAEAQAAVALEPNNPHWHHRVALSSMHEGLLAEAEAASRAAIAREPGASVFQDLLAQILQRQGRTDESVAMVQQVAEQEPEDPQRQLLLARTLLGSGQFAVAEAAARQAAALQPGLVEAYDVLSTILERQNRMPEAAGAARRAAELMPDDSGRHHHLGRLLFHAGDYVAAEHALRQSERLVTGTPTFHNHHVLGIILERQGRWEEALAEVRLASDLEPDNPDLLSRVAVMLRGLKRFDEAEAIARKAIALRPDSEQLQALLATVAAQRQSAVSPPAQAQASPALQRAPEPTPQPTPQPAPEPVAAAAQPMGAAAQAAAARAAAAQPGGVIVPQVAQGLPTMPAHNPQAPAPAPRPQWLSSAAMSAPLRRILMGRPKSGT